MQPQPDISRARQLSPAQSDEQFRLHQAALEWSLIDPIVIQSRDDVQSAHHWQGRVDPFGHQIQNLITFCRRLPVTLLADDVGLGKTISAGLILSELITRRRVHRALVVCPAILGPQWVDELQTKFGISARFEVGSDCNALLANTSIPVVVTTYDTARDRLANIRSDAFQMLILDEAHRLRNLHGGRNPPQVATRFRTALEQRLFRFVLMLTATPIQNRLWDIYSLVDCLCVARGHQNPLGSPQEFNTQFVEHGSEGRRVRRGRGDEFRRILRQYIVRTRRVDCRLLFPERRIQTIAVRLTPQEVTLQSLVVSLSVPLGPLLWTSLAQAMMSSPPAVAEQLENMAATRPALRDAAVQARAISNTCHESAKIARLLTLCRGLASDQPENWRVVVFTIRQETQQMIGDALRRSGISVGFIRGGRGGENENAIEDFRRQPPKIRVLVSGDAGAEGVNLQVCNVLVNYDLPWNPMKVEQRIGRVQRLASDHRHVVVMNLVAAGTIEERIVGRLIERLQMIAHSVGDIESILEAMDQEEDRFEAIIRNMVFQAAQGQDLERAQQLLEESIECAQQEYRNSQELVDSTLGVPNGSGETGPRLPTMMRTTPGLSSEQFVLDALGTIGTIVPPDAVRDVYQQVVMGRVEERFTFDERVADRHGAAAAFGNPVRLYQPGSVHFERLVEHWVNRAGHLIRDGRSRTKADAEQLARAWCDKLEGARFVSATVTVAERQFQGTVTIRAQAYNGVDRYEKLLHRAFLPEGLDRVSDDGLSVDPLVQDDMRPDDLLTTRPGFVTRAAENDSDICEFRRFYAARLDEERGRTTGEPALRARVEQDFAVILRAEAVALTGMVFDQAMVRVRFDLGRSGERGRYEIDIGCVPASGQILNEPKRCRCSVTALTVPLPCLARRSSTGQLVLAHLLAKSGTTGRMELESELECCQISGVLALPGELATCSVTRVRALRTHMTDCGEYGGWVLNREVGRSDFSGRPAHPELLFRSDGPSNRRGLPDEQRICSVTNQALLPDEVGVSDVSGDIARRDLLFDSESSGRLGLEAEIVRCGETGVRLLRDEVEHCEITGRLTDRRLLARSELSGAWGLNTCMGRCADTTRTALPAELGRCELTGLTVELGLLVDCPVTGRSVSRHRTGICEESGERFILADLAISAVSGRTVNAALLHSSSACDRRALRRELVQCQETQQWFLPDEVEVCTVTRNTVDARLLSRHGRTAQLVLTRLIQRCAVTGLVLLQNEVGRCELTGHMMELGLLVGCPVTGRRVARDRTGVCEESGQRLLSADLAVSAVSRLPVNAQLLRPSARSGRLALQRELVQCQETQMLFLPDEVERCTVTGRTVDARLLSRHGRTRQLVLTRLMQRCATTTSLVLKSELALCEITREMVLPSELERCEMTKRRGLRSRMYRSDLSGSYVVPGYEVKSAVSDRVGMRNEMVRCQWLADEVLRDEIGRCTLTHLRVSKAALNAHGQISQFALLLDGMSREARTVDHLIPELQAMDGDFHRAEHVWAVESPNRLTWAVCVELRSKWLERRIRYIGVILRMTSRPVILGLGVRGYREEGAFTIEDSLEFASAE